MNLVRKYKISKLLNKPLTGRDSYIISFIKEKLSDLIQFDYYNGIHGYVTYYMKPDGTWILNDYHNPINFYVRYFGFWEVLDKRYLMSNEEITEVMKYFIEDALKKPIKIPYLDRRIHNNIDVKFRNHLSKQNELSKEI